MEWYFFAIASAVFSSLAILLEKKILQKEHAIQFTTSKAVFCFLISFILIPFIDFNISIEVLGLLYITSLIVTIGIIFKNKSMRHMEVSMFAPLTNLSPLFLLILAYFILGEKLNAMQLSGISMLVFGSYVLEVNMKKISLLDPLKQIYRSKFIHFMLFALVLFSISQIFDKIILNNISPFAFIFFIWFFVALNSMVIDLVKFTSLSDIVYSVKNHGKLLFSVGIFDVAATFMYYTALSTAFVSLVVPVRSLSTIAATIIGGKIFHEHSFAQRVAACTIMLIGVALLVI